VVSPVAGPPAYGELLSVLEAAQDRGFLGPGDVRAQLTHTLDFAACVDDLRGDFLDLGSGGGIPGLVLAVVWPEARGLLVESSDRRCESLVEFRTRLDLESRLDIRCVRAEELGREPEHRERHQLVVSRSFGAPAVLAECAAPLLTRGGHLLVSEPRDPGVRSRRWPEQGLDDLGLEFLGIRSSTTATVAVMRKTGEIDGRWPRRVGIPSKRPLWR